MNDKKAFGGHSYEIICQIINRILKILGKVKIRVKVQILIHFKVKKQVKIISQMKAWSNNVNFQFSPKQASDSEITDL